MSRALSASRFCGSHAAAAAVPYYVICNSSPMGHAYKLIFAKCSTGLVCTQRPRQVRQHLRYILNQ